MICSESVREFRSQVVFLDSAVGLKKSHCGKLGGMFFFLWEVVSYKNLSLIESIPLREFLLVGDVTCATDE